MKNHTIPRPVRAFLVLLLLISGVIAFWSGMYTLAFWDDIWSDATYQESSHSYGYLRQYRSDVQELLSLEHQTKNESLTYSQSKSLEALRERLLPENTNFRYQVHDSNGNLLMGNLDGRDIEDVVSLLYLYQYDGQFEPEPTFEDDYFIRQTNESYILCVVTGEETLVFDPSQMTEEELSGSEQYGWRWEWDSAVDDSMSPETVLRSGSWYRSDSDDVRNQECLSYTIEYGLPNQLTVADVFSDQEANYYSALTVVRDLMPVFALFLAITLSLFVLLMRSAGWQKGTDHIVIRARDRWWYELYLAVGFALLMLVLSLGDSISSAYTFSDYPFRAIVTLAIFSFLIAYLVYLLADTTAVRLKAHCLGATSITLRGWRSILRFCRGLWRALLQLPLYGRAVVFFLLYLVGTLLTGATVLLIPFYQGAVLYAICRWIKQWRTIRAAASQVAEGNMDCQIDTKGMYHDLKEHAEQLNSLSNGLNKAVNERMKSEHFKSELITNVSHDLKTPLTSIINYVDLLKKTDIQDPKALEYIEVLDRKSQRLKKLTEDLVEASKASTGSLTVNREHLNVGQLVDQALAEYTDRLAASGLTPVMTLPEEAAYVSADGRHLWRVIDNLLSNCCKYAMPGTRVYLDVARWDGQVILSMKNISREALNVPADALMERFVRGDASRTTEGSGLGLSIARSLTELQGGSFRLAIDGDLFKAVVTFPEAPAQPELPSIPEHGAAPQ